VAEILGIFFDLPIQSELVENLPKLLFFFGSNMLPTTSYRWLS